MHCVITNPEATRTPGDRLHSAAERASSSQLLICVHELGRAASLKKIPDSSSTADEPRHELVSLVIR
jgi:hypothetical protein